MTAPSNANTSGLVEIAYARIENGKMLDLSRLSWGNYEPLVTAASAQARIDAAEARANRLEKALERTAKTFDLYEDEESADLVRFALKTALQQETQS